jgi:hypothetical protein
MSDGNVEQPGAWRRRSWVWIGLAAFAFVLAAGLLAWWLLTPHKLDVWKPATVPYSEGCKGGCKPVRTIGVAPGGPREKNPADAPQLVYNPRIDDAVAQWGDCLQSVMTCLKGAKEKNGAAVNACVARSQCPKDCKDHFAARTGDDEKTARTALFSTFIDADAVCRPEDARR